MTKHKMTTRRFIQLKQTIAKAKHRRGWKIDIARRYKITLHALKVIIDNPSTVERPMCADYSSLMKHRWLKTQHGKKCAFCGKCLAAENSEYCSEECELQSTIFRHHLAINADLPAEAWHIERNGRSAAQQRWSDNGQRPMPQMATC